MYSLFLFLYFLFWAISDFINAKIFIKNAILVDVNKRKVFRVKRGFGILGLALVALYVFIFERIFGIYYGVLESCLFILLPYSIPVIYLFILCFRYNIYKKN